MQSTSNRALLVVMAKEPVPGQVKTRLAPELSLEEAAGLYRCFLQDKIREVGSLDHIDLALAYTPASAHPTFAALTLNRFELLSQQGPDLGARLHNIFLDTLGQGYGAVSIVDSDSPDLPKSVIENAFERLLSGRAEVVFGPCHDGGYYLVGMRRPHPELFQDIPWSTAQVLESSLAKARQLGLQTELLPAWNDMDTFEDLLDFYERYKDVPPHHDRIEAKTFSFLARLERIKACSGG